MANHSAIPQQSQTGQAGVLNNFKLEVPIKDFLTQHLSITQQITVVYDGFTVLDRDIIFSVQISMTDCICVRLIRRWQGLGTVQVLNCYAATENMGETFGHYETEKLKSGNLVAGSDAEESSIIWLIMKRCNTSSQAGDFVPSIQPTVSYNTHRFQIPQAAKVVITGLIFYQPPPPTLPLELRSLLFDPETSDIEIIIKENKFFAHKLLLAARSPFFKAMFASNMRENVENVIKLPEENPKLFEQVLHYIYTDSCPEISNMAVQLLIAADKYDLQGLRALCEEEMMKTMNKDNVCDYLVQSGMFNSPRIYDMCVLLIMANIKEVTKSAGWAALKNSEDSVKFMEDIIIRMNK